jgi:NADH dehydrogenase FAD-containing subunit
MVRIVIIGGGIAGARVTQELSKFRKKGLDIKLIDKKEYFEVPYATLRGIVEPETIGKILRKKYSDFLKVKFILGRAKSITNEKIGLEDGHDIPFDIAIIATGSSYRYFSIPKPPDNMTYLKDREKEFQEEHQKLLEAQNILIIGGGAVGVELAGDIAYTYPEKNITLVEALPRLLSQFKPKASRIAQKQLESMSVHVIINEFLEQDPNDKSIWLSKKSKEVYHTDLAYICIGVSPNTSFMKLNFADTLTKDNRIVVNDKLQLFGHSNIYAIGDCSNVNEFKLGYFADKQAKFLVKNLKKILKSGFNPKTSLGSYKPKSTISIIPIGQKSGLVQLPIGTFKCKPLVAYKNKDLFIKRQFRKLNTVPNKI